MLSAACLLKPQNWCLFLNRGQLMQKKWRTHKKLSLYFALVFISYLLQWNSQKNRQFSQYSHFSPNRYNHRKSWNLRNWRNLKKSPLSPKVAIFARKLQKSPSKVKNRNLLQNSSEKLKNKCINRNLHNMRKWSQEHNFPRWGVMNAFGNLTKVFGYNVPPSKPIHCEVCDETFRHS